MYKIGQYVRVKKTKATGQVGGSILNVSSGVRHYLILTIDGLKMVLANQVRRV